MFSFSSPPPLLWMGRVTHLMPSSGQKQQMQFRITDVVNIVSFLIFMRMLYHEDTEDMFLIHRFLLAGQVKLW